MIFDVVIADLVIYVKGVLTSRGPDLTRISTTTDWSVDESAHTWYV
jgi:hypothetical protein